MKQALILSLLAIGFSCTAWAMPFDSAGKVVYVEDGDTVILLVDGRSQVKIRLASIDAPEAQHVDKKAGRVAQPYSDVSEKYVYL